jgi:2-succinyl-5-enolpyruvyl-6-hydroxy-3-cyclohexene-1-carboxylate synthase
VGTRDELVHAVAAPPSGTRVVEVRLDRTEHRSVHATLRAVAAAALAAG